MLESVNEIDCIMIWELSEMIVGVIMEFIIIGGGILMLLDGYMKKVEDICCCYGVFLICDEVICGFGWIGELFGFMYYGVKFDIIMMVKGIISVYLLLLVIVVKWDIFEVY